MTKRRTLSAVLCCLMLALSAGIAHADGPTAGPCPTPAGSKEEKAAALPPPVLCVATFTANQTDWYAIPLARGQRVLIQVTPIAPQFATSIILKDPRSIPANSLCSASDSLDTNAIDSCDLTVPRTGNWKLGVKPTAGLGSYQISVVATSAQTDCGTGSAGGDAPEGAALGTGGTLDATSLTLSATDVPGERKIVCTGTFSNSDAQDWYSFSAAAGELITILEGPDQIGPATLPPAQSRIQKMTLTPPSGGGKPVDDSDPTSKGKIVFRVEVGGIYYLELERSAYGNDGNPYVVTISVQQRDCGNDKTEASNDPAAPFSLDAGAKGSFISCLGALDLLPTIPGGSTPADATDWYSFTSTPGVPVAIGIDSSAGECHTMRVFRPSAPPPGPPASELTTCDGAAPAVFKDDVNASGGIWTIQIMNGASILSLDSYEFAYADTTRSVDSDAAFQVTVTSHADNTVISGLETRGLDANDFFVAPDSMCAIGVTLNMGQSCTADVIFRPNDVGPRAADLAISAGPNASIKATTRLVSLTGNGVSASIQFAPTSLAFATTKYGAPHTDPKTVMITNVNASSALSIGSVFVGGTNAGDFEISSVGGKKLDTCSNQILSPGASCTVGVDFNPQGNGLRLAKLIVPNDSGRPAHTDLTGTGQAPVPAVTPPSLSFPSTTLGSTTSLNLTVQNIGADDLKNLSTQFSGDFTLGSGSTCTTQSDLKQNDTCTFVINFAPLPASAEGVHTGSVKILSNAATVPSPVISLSGTATAQGASLVLTPADEVDFDAQVLNTTSAPQPVKLGNAGSVPLAINDVSLTPNHTEFAADRSGCPANLNPGSSCTITVTFKPVKALPRATNLVITATGGTTTFTRSVQLLGLGITAGGHLTISPAKPIFDDQLVGTTSSRKQIKLTNTGTAAVNSISLSTDTSEFAVRATSCGGSLAPNKSCTADLTFSPSALETRTGTLIVGSDEPGAPQSIPLGGRGLGPLASAPNGLSFPIVTLGDCAPKDQPHVCRASDVENVVVTNTGSWPLVVSSAKILNADDSNPDFSITSDTCTDQSRAAGQAGIAANGGTCTIGVVFTPADAGARTATLQIATDALGPSPTLQLSGIGTQPQSQLIGNGGAYTLTANGVAFTPPPPAKDCGLDKLDASNDIASPSALTGGPDFSCTGAIQDAADTGDFYSIPNVAPTDIVHVTFPDELPSGVLVCMYDRSGKPVDATYDKDGNLVACGTDHRFTSDEIGTTLVIGVTGPAGATYSFNASLLHQNDCGLNADAANTLDEAANETAIDASTPFVCSAAPNAAAASSFTSDGDLTDPNDGVDIFKVTTGSNSPTAGALAVTVTPIPPPDLGAGPDFDVIVHAPDGTTTAAGQNGGSGQPEVAVGHCGEPAVPCSAGVWYVEIRHVRGALGAYKMAIAGRTI